METLPAKANSGASQNATHGAERGPAVFYRNPLLTQLYDQASRIQHLASENYTLKERVRKVTLKYWISTLVAIICCLLLLGTCAHAEGTYTINLGGVTRHLRNDSLHNDVNPGVGLQYDTSRELGFAGGVYRNSDYHNSVYLYVRYQPIHYYLADFGVVGGIVSGYNAYPVMPAALLVASVPIGPVRVSFVGLPNIGRVFDGFVSLQLGVRL